MQINKDVIKISELPNKLTDFASTNHVIGALLEQ